jgi:hypothetical protein
LAEEPDAVPHAGSGRNLQVLAALPLGLGRRGSKDNMETQSRPAAEPVEAVQHRQRLIGQEIRRIYDSAVAEELPPEFLALLHQLDLKGERDHKS